MVFHVLNRGVARMQLFEKGADYQAFEQVLRETLDQSPMRICAYAVMPNHWHLLLWPECDGELAAFMQRLTITHVRRWQGHRGYAGLGHVYQGRYKSFPVESDEHFWVVARYVERNALRANLVLRAEEWRWSSLWQRCHPTGEERSLLAAWPIDMPANWLERVNQTDDAQELPPQRATRPPLWPAGMAAGNRATFGPRVGLSSHGSPAKGGTKSKCLARVKIARTSAGPPSLTILAFFAPQVGSSVGLAAASQESSSHCRTVLRGSRGLVSPRRARIGCSESVRHLVVGVVQAYQSPGKALAREK